MGEPRYRAHARLNRVHTTLGRWPLVTAWMTLLPQELACSSGAPPSSGPPAVETRPSASQPPEGPAPQVGPSGAFGPAGAEGFGSAEPAPEAPAPVAACGGVFLQAETEQLPADIVFVVDNSGSMKEEAEFVQEQMNEFSRQIVEADVDARVVVLSIYPGTGNGICIDAPLGSGECPGEDNNPPGFLHIPDRIDSHNALEKVLSSFPDYVTSLRDNAQQHIVVISDDDSGMSADEFLPQLDRFAPYFSRLAFHGIYAFSDGTGAEDQCRGLAQVVGTQYATLAERTGGITGDLCLQDFRPLFDRLAQAVVGSSRLPCNWALPTPPDGTSFDADLTNVRYSLGSGVEETLGRVASLADCSAAPDGWAWHYDSAVTPKAVVLCPAACRGIQQEPETTVGVEFGCPTVQGIR